LWHNPLGMKRCVLALMFASSAALAQEPLPGSQLDLHLFAPKPKDRTQSWRFTQILPPVNGQPRVFFVPEKSAAPTMCVVPLLAVPIDPNVDPKMKLEKAPKENIDNRPIAEGLPPCPSRGDAVKFDIPQDRK
jgi:hypothetical protein